ncbi:MAG: 1-deoxy-D-xylulose-5-phosphate reductoisomerase [bacterium]|nr:1-deoxy-D-xylulose-5-phosphate reductoisomerase [bacterium]
MKNVCILGATGSIGKSTLEVIQKLGPEYKVFALTCCENTELLQKQIEQFKPRYVCIANNSSSKINKKKLNCKVLNGTDGLCEIASHPDVNIVLNALVGSIGVRPTLAGIKANKTIAIANKETLVAYGTIIMKELGASKASLLPVDSEHSAIHQCLGSYSRGVLQYAPTNRKSNKESVVKRILLTASGGPFWNKKSVKDITPKIALRHPVWKMGKKITIDSATLMNKGFEVIEASVLFDVPVKNIEVVIHPQSIVHSMVEFMDSSVIAQMGLPDMKLPIQYALTYPLRVPSMAKQLDFKNGIKLEFSKPDFKKFSCLELAYESARIGGTMLAVLNAADEEVVKAFLQKKIKFEDIPRIIEKVMSKHKVISSPTFKEIEEAEKWAKAKTVDFLNL